MAFGADLPQVVGQEICEPTHLFGAGPLTCKYPQHRFVFLITWTYFRRRTRLIALLRCGACLLCRSPPAQQVEGVLNLAIVSLEQLQEGRNGRCCPVSPVGVRLPERDRNVLDVSWGYPWACESQDPADSLPCATVGPFIIVFNVKEILQKNYTGAC